MSDLSNLLGDLYGDSRNPDGPPVRHEPAAAERNEWTPVRSDDDLAAALSAALADAPAAPVMPSVAPAEPVAPVADYSMPISEPVAPVMPPVAAPIAHEQAPAPAARGAWTAAPADYEVAAPVAVAAPVMPAGPRMWARGDDDIFAMSGAAKKRK